MVQGVIVQEVVIQGGSLTGVVRGISIVLLLNSTALYDMDFVGPYDTSYVFHTVKEKIEVSIGCYLFQT